LELGARNVGHDADHEIDGPLERTRQCRVELAFVELDSVRPGARGCGGVDLGSHHPSKGSERPQAKHQRARPRAEVDSSSSIFEKRSATPHERLALPSRDVHARMDEHSDAAEENGADDPRKRLALDPASKHRREVLWSGRCAEQLIGLLFSRDTACLTKLANKAGARQSIGSSQIKGITRVVRD